VRRLPLEQMTILPRQREARNTPAHMTGRLDLVLSRSGAWLMGAGATLGLAVGAVMIWIPGGGVHWLLTSWAGRLLIPLSGALMASGAMFRRQGRLPSDD
jgi:hypothetical protein